MATPKLKYLKDTFSGSVLDTSKWVASGAGLSIVNGAAQLYPATDATTLESVRSYSLTQSEVEVTLGLLGVGETRELSMSCRVDSSNEVAILAKNDSLIFRVRVGGVNNDESALIDFDTMSHWRIEERSGLVYFYTSPDYVSWTRQRVATHGLDLSLVKLFFSCRFVDSPLEDPDAYDAGEYGGGFYGGVTGEPPDVAYIHNVNQRDPVTSSIPPVVHAPRAAAWRWAVGPWTDAEASRELLYAGTRSLQLHLLSPSEAQFTTWGAAEEANDIVEGISDLWVVRDAETLFRGRVIRTGDELDATTHSVSVSAIDYLGVLDRRNVNADVTFTTQDQSVIIQSLVETGQAETGGQLGITFGPGHDADLPATGVSRTVEFKDGQSIYSCISKLAGMENGFDVDIDEDKLLTLYHTQRGQDNGEVLDFGGNVVRVSRGLNMNSYGNAVRQSGSDGIASSTQYSDNISDAPEGRWDLQYGDIDLTTADMVVKTALAKVQKSAQLLPSYRLTLGVGVWRGPGHIWLGDYVYVVVKSGRLADVIKMRVYDLDIEVDINNHESVSVVVGDPKLTVASMLHQINRNIRALQRM